MKSKLARFSSLPRSGLAAATLRRGALLLSVAALLATMIPAPASAAETVLLRYGIFWGSLPMSDLTAFAETGAESPRLKRYLRMSNQEPAKLQEILNRPIKTEPRSLDLILSSPAGDALLDELSRYIRNSEDDDKAALRTAIERSAADDQKLSLLELLQNYPTEEVDINVRRAVATYQKIASIQSQVGGVLGDGLLEQIMREVERR
jgi:hypothetical protein